MHLIQFDDAVLGPSLGVVSNGQVANVTRREATVSGPVAAFHAARRLEVKLGDWLAAVVAEIPVAELLDYSRLLATDRVRCPIGEAEGQRVLVSGTGLTHTGSMQQRDAMHQPAATSTAGMSDSRKMFELGLAGGRPETGTRGVAPEWFYKGDGRILRGPGQTLDVPAFAPDGGEEPELAGVYVIDEHGIPCRLGFVQGNEWSDHVTENVNYLYLAPSKLRQCAIGPELILDLEFEDIRGTCLVRRDGEVIYESGELLTGERNMCHSLANLEDHHFKYAQHRIPGDVHVHFFGTSKLSFRHRDWKYATGDEIEVSFAGCGQPLRNSVWRTEPDETPVSVQRA